MHNFGNNHSSGNLFNKNFVLSASYPPWLIWSPWDLKILSMTVRAQISIPEGTSRYDKLRRLEVNGISAWGKGGPLFCLFHSLCLHPCIIHIPRIIYVVFIVQKMFVRNHLCSCFFSPYLCNEFIVLSPNFLFHVVLSAPERIFSSPLELFILLCLSFWWLQTTKYFPWKQGRALHFPDYPFSAQLG